MAGKTQVTLTFAGDASKLQKAADQAAAAAMGAGKDVAKAGQQFGKGAKFAQGYESNMTKVGVAVTATSSAFDLADRALSGLNDLQHRGERNAIELARAQGEVEQASIDAEQATIDLRQATEDLAQAQLDSKQAARDVAQAQLDVEQAQIDAEEAQRDYNQAVREHGKDSLEARQASLDLRQAQEDLNQANLDAEQATADARQASIDTSQAYVDQEQATRDAADASLNLREAQLGVQNPDMSQWINDIGSATSALALLSLATDTFKLSTIKATAATVAAKAATVATTAATGIATAAQWLWNIAMTANPIGLIIVAIGALVAAIIWIATKTTWFQDLWGAIWGKIGDPVKTAWEWIKKVTVGYFNWLTSLPVKIGRVFIKIADFVSAPFKKGFNLISDAWNNTVGKLSWSVPSWIPVIGGNSISAPKLPHFHTGGMVPGLPGQEVLAVLRAGENVQTAAEARRDSDRPIEIHIHGDLKGAIRKIVRVDGRGSVQTAFAR